jgi:hypothetical protein
MTNNRGPMPSLRVGEAYRSNNGEVCIIKEFLGGIGAEWECTDG